MVSTPLYSAPLFFLLVFVLVFFTTYTLWGDHPRHRKPNDADLSVPRILWTYLSKETPTPRQALCIETWRAHHPAPAWRIHVLTPQTVHGYLHGLPDLHYQAPLLRDPDRWEETVALHALTEHGGIWLHPHTYLRRALDESLVTNKKEVFAFSYRTSANKDGKDNPPVLSPRLLASPKKLPFLENWKAEYMRLLAFPSVEAYTQSLPMEVLSLPSNQTLPTEWVMALALQHSLLQHPYPMESVHLRSVENGPLRHLYEARGDPKKAEAFALHPASAEPIVFL